MLASLLVVFREVIEAGLVVGIVLAATRGIPGRGAWVGYGILGGVLGACVVAAFAGTIGAAVEGMGQELFNVAILLAAVFMLTWHNVWMARHGREIAQHMKQVGAAVVAGTASFTALSIVVGVAVLREGSEIVLFLYGIAISGNESTLMLALGGVLGLALGALLSAITYFGLVHIPSRHLFKVTGWMLALLAAGMAAQAVTFLEQAQIVTAFADTVWDTSDFISDDSILGKTLHTLIGYTAQPTGMQLIVYLATLAITFTLMRLFGQVPAPRQTASAT